MDSHKDHKILPDYTNEEQQLILEYRKANSETKGCIRRILHIEHPEDRPKIIWASSRFGNG